MTQNTLVKLIDLAQRYPDDPVIMCGLAEAYAQNRDFMKASSLYRKLIQLKPDYPAAYGELGKMLALSRKTREAIPIIQKGIEVAETAGDLQALKNMKAFLGRLEKSIPPRKAFRPSTVSLPKRG